MEDYQFVNSRASYLVRRHDNQHDFTVSLEHDLTAAVTLTFDYLGVINNSNVPSFDYDRNIVSAGVRVHF